MRLAAATGLVLVALNIVLIAVLFVRRWWVVRSQRRHGRLVEQLRPSAITFIESDTDEGPPDLSGRQREVFAELLAHYAVQIRGPSRQRIIGYFEGCGAVDDQVVQLGRRRAWRRATAANALGIMGSRRSVPDLVRMLGDRRGEVRMAATRSLGRLHAVEAIEQLVTAGVDDRVPRQVSNLALLDIGPAALPRLVELAAHDDPGVRASTLEIIGLLGTAGNAGPLLDHLVDPAAKVRASAANALGRVGAKEARDALMRALDDRVPPVRAAAARALGEIGGRQAAGALLPVSRHDDFEVARAAAEALSRIDPALVVRVAAEPDAGVHLHEAADRLSL